MELLDRDTFLEWMERIMSRFDHLKQTIPDIPQRPMLNGEPLLDNQEVCMMLQISKRTLQRYRDSGTLPFHIIYHKNVVSGVGDNRLYETSFHREHEKET